ncbi:hypothetical protein L210DRAFT_3530802 [Boletus edulis BED1]|uniref:Uncharacterized protein n=1 Tax=Boletus edulis BED1 TaxID=1328754 RepID=A0AAD4BZW8_BOLED|nr:hypothetical protein L210DRAFT_3530802 [Boletus edulis BED1]
MLLRTNLPLRCSWKGTTLLCPLSHTIFSFPQGHCASGHVLYRLLSSLQGHCASGHVRYRLLSSVPLDTFITITSWTTCDSNPDDRLGTGTSILGTS